MILGTLAESVKPDKGTDGKYDDGIGYEDPVEKDETNSDVIPLNDSPNG